MALNEIFTCSNDGEFRYGNGRNALNKPVTKLEEGVCFAMSVRWCKTMIQLGEVKNVSSIGNKATFEMIQVAFEKGHASKAANDRTGMKKIVQAQGMNDLDYQDFNSVRAMLLYVTNNHGYWIVGIGAPGEGAHQVAFRTSPNKFHYFDSNVGSRTGDTRDVFVQDVYQDILLMYPDFRINGSWQDAMKVHLL